MNTNDVLMNAQTALLDALIKAAERGDADAALGFAKALETLVSIY